MKSGQIFWGLFFISLGLLYVTSEYDIIDYNWNFIWSLWASVLIFWGAQLMTKGSFARPIVDGIFGVVMAFLIFGSLNSLFNENYYYEDEETNYKTNLFSSTMDSSYIFGNLQLKGGAGYFEIREETDKLFEGVSIGDLSNYSFKESSNDNEVNLDIYQTGDEIKHIRGDLANKLEIKLNPALIWKINLKIGAAKSRLDLAEFKIRKIDLNTGVTNTAIKLGDKYEQVDLNVEMGVSSLKVMIPKKSGCKISGEMALVLKDLEDFDKGDDGNYYTSNYQDAKNRINIKINSGVSKFEVEAY